MGLVLAFVLLTACLHGVRAVAELKRSAAQPGRLAVGGSPRRPCRGQIDPPTASPPPSHSGPSPRRPCRGRIEAVLWANYPGLSIVSPRRPCRGRIEAERPLSGERCLYRGLHGVRAVAELKQSFR